MRKLFLASALSLCAMSANAAGIYVLTEVASFNQFTGFQPSEITLGSVPYGGQAVVDADGNVVITDLQFSGNARGQIYTYTDGMWLTTVGGNAIANFGMCTDIGGSTCSNPDFGLGTVNGLSAMFDSMNNNSASPDTSFCPPVGITPGPAGGLCNQVSVVEDEGVSLIITEQSEFAGVVPNTPLGYQFTFTVIPVPAAVWLFASALGLLGWVRRKAA